jgi:hypothetical protein
MKPRKLSLYFNTLVSSFCVDPQEATLMLLDYQTDGRLRAAQSGFRVVTA